MSTATLPLPLSSGIPTMSIVDKTVLLNLSFGAIGNSKKVSPEQIDVGDADRGMVHVAKDLLDAPELKAVVGHRRRVKEDVKHYSLPSIFRSGIYLIPHGAVEKVENIIQEGMAKDTEVVGGFLAVYDTAKAAAEQRLGALYDAMDYPSIATVRAAFTFERMWLSFSTPEKLREVISTDFFEQEKQSAARKWSQATEQITLLLRQQFKENIDHMVDALKPDEEGNKKRFHSSKLKAVTEFLESFSIKNVTEDADLAALVDITKTLLNTTSPDAQAIRDSDHMREMLQKGFTVIQQHLDPLVEQAGSRQISFDGE